MNATKRFNKSRNKWFVHIRVDGKRKCSVADSESQADEMIVALRRTSTNSLGSASSRVSLADHCKSWLDFVHTSSRASTLRFYDFNVRLHIVPHMGHELLQDITRPRLIRWLRVLKSSGLSVTSVTGAARTLSAALTHAMDCGLITHHPAYKLGKILKSQTQPKMPRRAFTRAEVIAILDTVKVRFPHYYPMMLCAFRTAMRQGELIALRWADVLLDSKQIAVSRSADGPVDLLPKNGKPRVFKISEELCKALSDLKTAQGTPSDDAHVFVTERGIRIDADNFRKRIFRKVLESAAVRLLRFHEVRHTSISHMLEGASYADIDQISRNVGHSDVTVTLKVYGHLLPGNGEVIAERLDRYYVTVPNPADERSGAASPPEV